MAFDLYRNAGDGVAFKLADMATKIDIQFYQDARDALLKAIVE